jgi:hypothetical protein
VRALPHDGAGLRAGRRKLKGRALLVKVNSDDNPGLSQRFGIRSIPTLVRLQQGRETAAPVGRGAGGQHRGAGWRVNADGTGHVAPLRLCRVRLQVHPAGAPR